MVFCLPMPVVAAPLFGLSLGVLFAWAGAEDIARSAGSIVSRSLAIAALFGVLVFAPACAYFQAFFPDWSYAYFVDSQHPSIALDLALVLVDALSVPVGLALFGRSAAARRVAVLTRAAAIPAFAGALFLIALSPRLRVVSTYAQFHGDFGTQPLTGSPAGWALLWMTMIIAGAVAWTVRVLRRLTDEARAN
jgi:hypothetical protein